MKPEVDIRRTVKAFPAVYKPDESGCWPEFAAPGGVEPRPNSQYLMIACPGCGDVSGMAVNHPKPAESPSWDIVAGDVNDPTTLSLHPSINCTGCCGWHGYLTNGVFTPC